ncbi:MAG TPA: BREX system ATP-binding domain-containing protein [Thermoleophilaceae bacterium]|nr:BREX system ATP-binding domain-containing protein [Thermoleophilaceae bacterium]
MDSWPSPTPARLVGRDAELEQLEAALDTLDDGGPAYVTVEGEPGIGKTRLLDELRARAQARGHVVLSGASAEFEREMPFGVWVDALDAYVASQELARHESWDEGLAAELGQVLPALRAAGGDGGAVADERFRAHRAVSRLLGLIAEEKPLVLVLDDLHWSDGASVELIAALARRAPDAPVLIALGFRPGQVALRLTAALAGPRARRLELGQLSEADATLLLAHLERDAAAAVYRHGGGNPFYLEQLGRMDGSALAAQPASGAANGGVPPAVAGAIAAELGSLPERARLLLGAAAVAGEPFDLDLAVAISDVEAAEALPALDELLDADLVRPTQVPRRFVFRHPLVRRAVYEGLGGGWRLSAHAHAAETLAARGAAPAEQAHHVEQSAGMGDEDAVAVLMAAGEAAAARAPAAAARWFAAALRLIPGADSDRQVSVRVSLAEALRSLGELERCSATLIEALEMLPPESVVRRAEITTSCAAVEHWLGRHDAAHRRLFAAWEELADRSSAVAAALQIELCIDGFYTLDHEQTVSMGRGALETARALGDRALIGAAASALSVAEASAGQIDDAREHLEEAIAHVDHVSDAELAPYQECLCYLAWAENYLERYEDAIAHADRGIRIGRATGEGRVLAPMMLVKGFPFEMQGRMPEAVELCETVVEATRLSANPHYHFWALFELGWAHYYSGNLDEAIAAGEESARVGGVLAGATMPSAGGGPGWQIACTRFEAGEVERARDEMRALGSDELEHKIPVERCFDWEILALVELASGNMEAADGYARRAEDNAERLGLCVPFAVAGRARAAVLLAAGQADEAARAADRSAEIAGSVGARLQATFSRGLAGRALAAAGDRSAAIEALREAERAADECGSVRFRDEMRRELRKLGARAEVRGPATAEDAGMASLTKRELEIAELITDRLTNPQIAGRLFLSKKTVESHIRNLFVKLGASSRVEVARIVERDRRERAGITGAP